MENLIIKKQDLKKYERKGYNKQSAIAQYLRTIGYCLHEDNIMITKEFKYTYHISITCI